MPRVHIKTKATYGKDKTCTGCGQKIEVGEKHYSWKSRNTPERCRHLRCGRPRASELSNAKTAVVDDAIEDATEAITSWDPSPDDDPETSIGLLTDILASVAQEARGVADEYEEGVGNLPENLQYGTQAESMNEVASRLNDWADALEQWSPDEDAPEGDDKLEDWASWVEVTQQSAKETMEDLPTYEG